jgi:hypothetical protein
MAEFEEVDALLYDHELVDDPWPTSESEAESNNERTARPSTGE